MAFRCTKLLRIIRNTHQRNVCSSNVIPTVSALRKPKEIKTEDNIIYLEDPDTFGNLSRKFQVCDDVQDEGDLKEEKYIKDRPLASKKLTIMQYADIIKQYVNQKRLKEAINVLEVRMLQEDRVKPENYIYNILIGACAEVGYTRKAFQLFNDMKRRALKLTGDTYTCLFHACANSPWALDGLKNATHLRALMMEKGIEPNLTNYNSMIKAFGRCGDLSTAFKIVDEMISKGIKIRVQTFNNLLHACISDKENGLRHALIIWRKMLKLREKPNIYSFNLMLKCVKDCNLGPKTDIEDLISYIQGQIAIEDEKKNNAKILLSTVTHNTKDVKRLQSSIASTPSLEQTVSQEPIIDYNDICENHLPAESNRFPVIESNQNNSLQLVDKSQLLKKEARIVPNLLSSTLNLHQVQSLQAVETVQDKFAVVGGQEDYLREMASYSVKPDVKTFTQMIPLLDNTKEAEIKLLETIRALEVKADIDFYNILIKKRCMRQDYEGAFEVKDIIDAENKYRKKRYRLKKNLQLKLNVMSYGVLAMACQTKEQAELLLNEMKDNELKVNIEILGALLRQGTSNSKFGYILHIMNIVKDENIPISQIFLKHLEDFNEKCMNLMKQNENGRSRCSDVFVRSYKDFSYAYKSWLNDINVDRALTPEHPWQQFREEYPETIQRQKFQIKEPKKFYKRNRKFVKYAVKL